MMDNNNNVKTENLQETAKKRTLMLGGYSMVLVAIVIAAAIFVNLIVEALPSKLTKIDLSGSDIYRISEDSKALVDGLSTDITVYLVSTEETRNAQLNTFLENYASLSKHIKLKYVDPEADPAFVSQYGITAENSLVVISPLRYEVIPYGDIYQYSETILNEYYYKYYMYGYAIEDVCTPDIFDADNQLTSAIDYVTTEKLPTVYLLTGHGESALTTTVTDVIVYNNIGLSELTILGGDIPDDASVIVINNPGSDLVAEEVEKLTSFIDNGGNVILVTDPANYDTESMKNVTLLAEHCGLTAHDGIVLEEDTGYYSRNQYTTLPRLQESIVTSTIENPTSYFAAMNRAHAIVEDEDYEGGNMISPILLTSETAYVIGEEEEVRARKDGDVTGQFYLGAVSTDFNSNGRLIWYSSSFINDDTSMSYVNYNNLVVFSNSVTVVCEKPATITIDSVAINQTATLTLTETDVMIWTVILQYVIPLAILIPGIVIWIKRRRR